MGKNMYTLPNGIKIDEDGIIEAMKNADAFVVYYFDSVTGQTGAIKKGQKKLGKSRYFKIPGISESKMIEFAKGYVKVIMRVDDPLSAVLLKCLQKKCGGFDKFYKMIEKTDEIYGWPQWEYDHMGEEMGDWLDTLPFDIQDEWEFDCNCAMCQVENFNQKFGRYPRPAELFKFMKEQKEKNK